MAVPDVAQEHAAKRFKNLALAKRQTGAHQGVLNPALCYIRDLERAYSDFALFFVNKYEPLTVGVLWNPLVLRKQPFRISIPFPSKPDSESTGGEDANGKGGKGAEKPNVVADKAVILAEMVRLGKGLAIQASMSRE